MEASYCKYYIIKSNLDINFYENIELMRVAEWREKTKIIRTLRAFISALQLSTRRESTTCEFISARSVWNRNWIGNLISRKQMCRTSGTKLAQWSGNHFKNSRSSRFRKSSLVSQRVRTWAVPCTTIIVVRIFLRDARNGIQDAGKVLSNVMYLAST